MKILLASSNSHKLDEIRAVFHEMHANDSAGTNAPQLVSLNDVDLDIPQPVEDGATFQDNAFIKACYYARAAKMLCLADDSGLEVDALNGEPGVRSARYAGVAGPRSVVDPANNRLLLERLGDTPIARRGARFVCAMALAAPLPRDLLALVHGTIQGRILTSTEAGRDACGRGDNGFGYDPLFFVPDLNRTTAELSPRHKNAVSHRGNATRLMWRKLHEIVFL